MREERRLIKQGYALVAGLDEVGRGALAGPVVAAAVILPRTMKNHWQDKVRDSKQLTPAQREYLFPHIQETAVAFGIGRVSPDSIDRQGIAAATRLAMKLAVAELSPQPHYLLIDYFKLPEVALPQKGIKFGDSLCLSIACASIVAKVTRDRLMVEMDDAYPGYGLARHKGYATEAHCRNLQRQGPCPVHRRSFMPVKGIIER